MDAKTRQVVAEVGRRITEAERQPFVVAVMGQTGVGKSSLINALFGTELLTDAARPCTKKIERVIVNGGDDRVLWFYDMPGLGEAGNVDQAYVLDYRAKLLESDVVIWAIHADNRSVAFDLSALEQVLGADRNERVNLMSKIIFVLTKVDLLTPPPWIFNISGNKGVFAAGKATRKLLQDKERYYQETFIWPYGDLIVSRTYNPGGMFDIGEGPLSFDDYTVTYRGLLRPSDLLCLQRGFPQFHQVFDRLYDNYRVIACSSLFRFNLSQLMLVIVNKLGEGAIGRFSNFTDGEVLNQVDVSKVKSLGNLVVFDRQHNQLVFDLAQQQF
jgi:uncharacterized protein